MDRESKAELEDIKAKIANYQQQIEKLKERSNGLDGHKNDKKEVILANYREKVAKLDAEVQGSMELAAQNVTDTTELQTEAEECDRMKNHVWDYDRMKSIMEETDALEEKRAGLTAKIDRARTLPGEILGKCEIPIEGLTVRDGVPLINGLSISNLSEGEKLQLCIDVTVKNPSGLGIVLIDGTEKLTEENRKKLFERCKERGLQIIATRTTEDRELTINEL